MIVKVQMPGHGCDNCGKYAEETQSIKRKRLRRIGSHWLCWDCTKAEKRSEYEKEMRLISRFKKG